MDILSYIPFGEKNAVSRTSLTIATGLSDRVVRSEIQKAREEHIILNAQDGRGYYRPLKEDCAKIKRWLMQEKHRAKSIIGVITAAEKQIADYR